MYDCKTCSLSFMTESELGEHNSAAHYFQCDICLLTFKTESNRMLHTRYAHGIIDRKQIQLTAEVCVPDIKPGTSSEGTNMKKSNIDNLDSLLNIAKKKIKLQKKEIVEVKNIICDDYPKIWKCTFCNTFILNKIQIENHLKNCIEKLNYQANFK